MGVKKIRWTEQTVTKPASEWKAHKPILSIQGYSQVGKAQDFDSYIRRFESYYPCQRKHLTLFKKCVIILAQLMNRVHLTYISQGRAEVARQGHILKVVSSILTPAPKDKSIGFRSPLLEVNVCIIIEQGS